MPACKTCGAWFVKVKPQEELCDKCECALDRLSGYVTPVAHGRWIMHDDEFGLTCECSACHIKTMGDGNYCPNCGAKMDGGRLMKQDMSKTCGFGYQAMWVKRDSGEISEKEFIQWYDEHCANCLYMNEICMLGEVE